MAPKSKSRDGVRRVHWARARSPGVAGEHLPESAEFAARIGIHAAPTSTTRAERGEGTFGQNSEDLLKLLQIELLQQNF